jgi:hypothetical protein
MLDVRLEVVVGGDEKSRTSRDKSDPVKQMYET